MKIEMKTNYESPIVEVIEVESGFAASSTPVDGSSTTNRWKVATGQALFLGDELPCHE